MEIQKDLWKAIHSVQSEVNYVHKDATNPHYRSRYATLGAVLEVLRPVALKNGLIIMQAPGMVSDGCISLLTSIIHVESGQRLDSMMSTPLPKGDPQGAGSAISYGCRYSLMALFALSALEDDDAEQASRQNTQPREPSPRVAGSDGGTPPSGSPPVKLSDTASLAMFEKLKAQMMKYETRTALSDWAKGDVNPVINSLRDDDFHSFRMAYSERLKELPA